MTTARRAELRRIMQEAWSWMRQVGGTFADALRAAWRGHKARMAPKVVLRRVKPRFSAGLSPLANGATLAARAARRQGHYYGAKVGGW